MGLLYAGEVIAEGSPRELARAKGMAPGNFEAVFLELIQGGAA